MDQTLLEEYLRKYPSGHFAELAQLELDRLLAQQGEKKVAIAAQEGNPYTKGSAEFDVNYKLGDTYKFQRLDLYTKLVLGTGDQTVEKVTDSDVVFSGGLITDLLGNVKRFPDGRLLSANQNVPTEFAIGKAWTTRFHGKNASGQEAMFEFDYRVTARESITVPAGTFNAFRIDGRGYAGTPQGPLHQENRQWYDPQRVRMPVLRETIRRAGRRVIDAVRIELVSFKQG